jgi:hypothetical protein
VSVITSRSELYPERNAGPDERWEVALRAADSPQFQRSPKLRDFLLFVCERALQNKAEDLREQSIGFRVFGRRPDYNPAEDNIVRVEARQLRKRLEEYFLAGGKDEKIVITVPKGSYVARFETREPAATPPVDALQTVLTKLPSPAVSRPPSVWLWRVAAVFFAILCLFLWRPSTLGAEFLSSSSAHPVRQSQLWSQLFNSDNETHVVCADTALVLLQDITHRPVSLAEYLTRDYSALTPRTGSELDAVVRLLPSKQYTSVADIHLIEKLLLINHESWNRTSIRSPRNLHPADFKNDNFVLLGSSRANPWNELFEPQLNFVWDYDERIHQPFIRNIAPLAQEQKTYWAGGPNHKSDETYSVIDFLPNLGHTGNVLIIAGATMEGTEAAGEYITNPEFAGRLLDSMHAIQNGKVVYFEALLRSGTLAGTSRDSQIVAFRIQNGLKRR